jgi:hypothetical protein
MRWVPGGEGGMVKIFSNSQKRGCPTCNGVDAKSCMRCRGETFMCLWFNTDLGWSHLSELTLPEREQASKLLDEASKA